MNERLCVGCGADSLEVGVEIAGVYDGVLFYQCFDCGHRRHRWSKEDHPDMWAKAERWVNAEQQREQDSEGAPEADPERA